MSNTPDRKAVDNVVSSARTTASQVGDHPAVEGLARLGYAASGLMHLLIGWIALGIAWGTTSRGDTADQSGAFATLSETAWGRPLLWFLVAGFAGLGLWQIADALGGWHPRGRDGAGSRVKAVSKAVAYLFLAWTSLVFARGGSSSSSGSARSTTADILSMTGGVALVTIGGLVVLGVGIYHVIKGAKRKFLEDLAGSPGAAAEYAGMAGYIAKGIALMAVGVLLTLAALRHDPSQSRGLDGALRALASTGGGTALLTLIALGIAAYGVYSFFRARYAKV